MSLTTCQDAIAIQGMQFFGRHGVLPHEKRYGQAFRVDLEMHLPLKKAGQTDHLRETVNYCSAFEAVRAVMEGKPYKLIEAVAEQIAASLLAKFPQVQRVRVRVHKPAAPISGLVADVYVEITRERTAPEETARST